MLSYWEKQSFTRFDTIIIGAGLSGLFTALFLKRKYPKEKILVVGRGTISDAASTKNAGFACLGSITELDDDLQSNPLEKVVNLVTKRYRGLQVMRKELGDRNIAYKENGSFELLQSKNYGLDGRIEFWNNQLTHLGIPFTKADVLKMPFKGFNVAIKNNLEGELDTGKMYKTLKQKVFSLGVEIFTNTSVQRIEAEDNIKKVHLSDMISLQTTRLICCTNAFTEHLWPNSEIKSARAQVLITKPIAHLGFKGIYHFDRGYYYFREVDGRVLFGGGRQLDFKAESTSAFGNTKLVLDDLKEKLEEFILPNHKIEIDSSWSGIMGMNKNKTPIVKELSADVYILAGLGGMGVALAPQLAKELVEIL